MSETDPLGHKTTYSYDGLNEVMTVTDPDNGVTTYTHDRLGDVTSTTDPGHNTTSWVYDGLGRVIQMTDPLGHSETYQYDLDNNLVETVDRDGCVTEYAYDHLNRETNEYWYASVTAAQNDPNHTNAEDTFTYTYDLNNNMLSASDNSATYSFTVDPLGRDTGVTVQMAGLTPSVTLNETVNANGNRTQLTASIGGTADFVNNYTYDDLGRLSTLTQGSQTGGDAVAPKRVNFSYDEDSQWSTISQYADLAGTEQVATATYNYDYDGNLTGLSYAQANSTGLPSYTWTYNAAGLVTQMTSPDGTVSDTYDADNQLTQASSSNPLLAESHTFDSNGNRTDSGDSTGADNQVTSDGTFNYTTTRETGSRARGSRATTPRTTRPSTRMTTAIG